MTAEAGVGTVVAPTKALAGWAATSEEATGSSELAMARAAVGWRRLVAWK